MMPRTARLSLAAALAMAAAGCSQDGAAPGVAGAPPAQGPAAPPLGTPTPAPVAPTAGEPVGEPIAPRPARDPGPSADRAREAVKKAPEDRAALLALIRATQAEGSRLAGTDRKASLPIFAESAAAARTLRDAHKSLSPNEAEAVAVALYNDACSLAIQDGKADAAMAALKEAMAAGFREEILKTDPELDSLRGRDDFKALMADPDAASASKPEALLRAQKSYPFALDLKGIDGTRVTLDGLKGKVAVVDFWGTWCPSCREDLPRLAALQRDLGGRGLEVVGINCQEGDGPAAEAKVRAFLEEHAVPYRCALSDEAVEAQIPEFVGFPTTLLLDRTGKVRMTLGPEDDRAALARVAKALLDGA